MRSPRTTHGPSARRCTTLACDPADYPALLDELRAGGISAATRRRLAVKGFAATAHYDSAIAAYLGKE